MPSIPLSVVRSSARAAVVAAATLYAADVRAGDADLPAWALASAAGFTVRGERETQPSGQVSRDLVFHGAAGVSGMYRLHLGPVVAYAEGMALPAWSSTYGGRAGMVIGWQGTRPYSELISSSQDGTTVKNTYGETADRVKWVSGLQAGAGYWHSPRGNTPIVELGIGWIGQNTLDLLAIYEPSRSSWGARLDLLRFTRTSWVSVLWGVQLQTLLQDMRDQPLPVTLTFALGIGEPFSFKLFTPVREA